MNWTQNYNRQNSNMKNSNTLVILVVSLLFIMASSYIVTQDYVNERNYGIFSQYISAQQDLGVPAQYFVCGAAFRDMKWIKSLWNCNCGRRWFRWKLQWRCNWCDNTFWSMKNAVKITFCSYSDWNNQIEKQFYSGNADSGSWNTAFKCPKGQWVSRAAGRFGYQHETDLGLVGAQFKCQSMNFAQSSLVQDSSNHALSELSKNKQGNFVSAVQIKYEKNGKLTGIRFGFEGMPVISKISVKYDQIKNVNPKTTLIDSGVVMNYGSTIAQNSVTFAKNYTIQNKWTNNQSFTHSYIIGQGVSVNPVPWKDDKVQFSTYTSKQEDFAFSKSVSTTYSSTQQLLVLVPPKKKITVSSVIQEQNVSVPYEAVLSISDRFSGEFIKDLTVKGVWQGVMASSVRTVINEESLPDLPQSSNLRSDGAK